LRQAPEDVVELVCLKCVSLFNTDDLRPGNKVREALRETATRSTKLAKFIFRYYPDLRQDILNIVTQQRVDWLKELATEFGNDEAIVKMLGTSIINAVNANPLEALYEAVGRINVRKDDFKNIVSGRSKPAKEGRMKTSHFEERIALRAMQTAQRRDESTQRELATFNNDLGGAWLVPPADCA
jgi:hypothetical protein